MSHRRLKFLSRFALLGLCISAFREFLPIIVHFFLRLATDLERDGLVECEHQATVERGKGLPLEFKKATVMTIPAGLPWTSCSASPYRVILTIREFLKIAV
jgi:hypothetical protein